ncbi:methyl-accepting chemotaxis protein [Vibrio fluvialis]|uniref:Methyl-accepting chemotaxis protein n=1 Tax=Vibrio fluvialis TaxID=676 RepID=A0AAX2LVX7_VIBFL|nr:methyl-accepting chemotaxis protein [Vibrio fluvialis]AMF92469.1 methyl-accepting chemotaxis protein [Vibrio fluvialis]EKO3950512.1 methyl-accepting chemotaxis protein [Vibrio fluvialis]EKO4000873.1 methyl-accepting chemotaxis protein [Vibrio fluvialis]EKO4010990.1 methyl-accepting chemotaxis protein [Vibrio fluvialis]ELG2044281.1 methyl-accepting chemotaxis protein [Vibrio fluvialis]
MNIKQKLYLLGFIAVMGIISLVITTTHFARQTNELSSAIGLVEKLEIRLLNLRRNEKDFLLRKDAKYLDTFKQNSELFLSMESQLSTILTNHNLASSAALKADLLKYKQGFEQLVGAYQVLGLSDGDALLAKYHALLAQAENGADAETLLALANFDEAVKAGKMLDMPVLSQYSALVQAARGVIEQEKLIGLAYNEGYLGNTRSLSHNVEEQFKTFSETLTAEVSKMRSELDVIKQIVTVIVVIVILGFIWQISRSINLQVQRLLQVMQNIASTNNVGLRTDLQGRDELTSIGTYFNQLLDKFEHLISGSQAKSHQLTSSTTSMHNELEEVINQFHVQADHTTMMATSVQEMVATIGEISESTNVAVEGVQQAVRNAENGRSVVESTLKNIDQLSTTLQSSQQSIASLNDHVEKIGGAVTIIQSIAEQTNLLALNAAIEAARAGEQGRGFAVVADEVRSLATRTHQSTEEITKVVSAIQAQMSLVISDIDQCNSQGQETLHASHQLDESLRQIITDMSTIQANSERIASAIEEQGIVMNQVSGSIAELNTISENNMHSAQEVLSEVDSVSQQARQMDEAVSEFQTR